MEYDEKDRRRQRLKRKKKDKYRGEKRKAYTSFQDFDDDDFFIEDDYLPASQSEWRNTDE